jgi:hypothetical protein
MTVRIAEQERIAVQDKRITTLERAASRNWGNSSMSPCSDDLPGCEAPPGGAVTAGNGVSAPAAGLWSGPGLARREVPDDTIPHYPFDLSFVAILCASPTDPTARYSAP